MRKLVLQIRRRGQLIGHWELGDDPLELGILDGDTRKELLSMSLKGADLDAEEETLIPTGGPRRIVGDDLTIPLPEKTNPTEEISVPGILRARTPQPHQLAPPRPLERMELERIPGDDLTMPLPEQVDGVAPAEVWRRWKQSWRRVCSLRPGQQVSALGAQIRLSESGELLVDGGDHLSGSATLPSGERHPITTRGGLHTLPPGTSVMLRRKEQGLYVRSYPLGSVRGPRASV